jgi:hypothetical protein
MKYDADLKDPLAKLRIPVVGTIPDWRYLATLDENGQRPTPAEARILSSFIDFERQYWFTEPVQERMLAEPFDVPEDGHNTITFLKYDHGGWGYRHATWEVGPAFRPMAGEPSARLLAVLGLLLHSDSKRRRATWADWTESRLEIFQ